MAGQLAVAASDAKSAQRCKDRLRRTDVLARLGGDEFLVAVTGLDPATATTQAADLASQLGHALRVPMSVDGRDVHVQASVGVSTYPHDGDSFGALLHLADTRMYAAKHPDRTR